MRRRLSESELAEAAAAVPSKTIDKLFVWQAAHADRRTSKADLSVLGVLIENQNKHRGYSWGAVSSIAAAANISQRATQMALRRLEQFGYIVIDGVGGAGPRSTNHYYVKRLRMNKDSPIGANNRAPLAFPRRASAPDPKGERDGRKDELDHAKGERDGRKRANGRSPDPTYDPCNMETTYFQNPSAPAACALDAHATKDEGRKSKCSDPLSSLPHDPHAFLARVERRVRGKERPSPTTVECDAWLEQIEALAADRDPDTGGWATRVYEQVATCASDLKERDRYRRDTIRALSEQGKDIAIIARMSQLSENAVSAILREAGSAT